MENLKSLKQFVISKGKQKIIGGNQQVFDGGNGLTGGNACLQGCQDGCHYASNGEDDFEVCFRACRDFC